MTFLIPYFIFVALIGSTGIIGEMSLGRATGAGPIGAFGQATKLRTGNEKTGEAIGLIPVLGSMTAISPRVMASYGRNFPPASAAPLETAVST